MHMQGMHLAVASPQPGLVTDGSLGGSAGVGHEVGTAVINCQP
jgi:hypothetical protein